MIRGLINFHGATATNRGRGANETSAPVILRVILKNGPRRGNRLINFVLQTFSFKKCVGAISMSVVSN